MPAFDFLKKLKLPPLELKLMGRSPSVCGIDIGSESVKVVQLKKERERAILETYGELKSERYFNEPGVRTLLQYRDEELRGLLTDVLREANVTTHRAVLAVPSASSFITLIHLPFLSEDEIRSAIPFEAKKYVPIPTAEVLLDWQIVGEDRARGRVEVLLVAVPQEVIAKLKRVAELAELEPEGLEIESFSLARSLLGGELGCAMVLNWGAVTTGLTIAVGRQIRLNHNVGRGSREITSTLSKSLGVTIERAEDMKKQVGLSEKPEERAIRDTIAPFIDSTLADAERILSAYNRSAERKVEKIYLAGGGANLLGLVDYVSKHFGLETAIGNAFARTMFPAFLQPLLREIAPGFAVAVGLALRPITSA